MFEYNTEIFLGNSDSEYFELPSFLDEKEILKTVSTFLIFMLVNDFQVENQKKQLNE